uniref:Uncharacterized protein n=1 Tax=Rhizophora mucronata TaxID=61149 RepID=A0A2P2PRR6_RHIMU
MCPTPPSPNIPPLSPLSLSPKWLSGLYTVTPAHSSGAACTGDIPSGIFTTNF